MYLQLMLLAMLIVPQQKDVPVQSPSGAHKGNYVCNFAKVKDHRDQRKYLLVRSGAGAQFRVIDQLRSGQEVYICDESGDWYQIFYSKPDGPCGSTSSNGLDVKIAGTCQSGWVKREWINVISG